MFDRLKVAAAAFEHGNSLVHQPFVDHYYTGQQWCRLFLACDRDGSILATQGVELMPFLIGERSIRIGYGSNFHSIRPGLGAVLFLKHLETCPLAMVFGGSEDSHKILTRRGWTYYTGAHTYILNRGFTTLQSDPFWRRSLKAILRQTARRPLRAYLSRIPRSIRQRLTVREEYRYTPDLLPQVSPFTVRFAPTADYLEWRYNTALSFVRYRAFRILDGSVTRGYVVLSETADHLIVAHCDGDDAVLLAYGVVLSIIAAGRNDIRARSAMLVASYPAMQRIFEEVGFVRGRLSRRLALGGQRAALPSGTDTATWLVNFDWGDNGLRIPFLDQQPAGTAGPQ